MTDNFDLSKLPDAYQNVFAKNTQGIVILDHLWSHFSDRAAKQPLDPLDLAYREGQRSVIRFIQSQRDRLENEAQQQTETQA